MKKPGLIQGGWGEGMKATLFASLFGLSCASAWAQATSGFGAVSGFVIQAGSEGLPDATVLLSNKSLGTKVTMITTDDGVFAATTVVPADGYTLQVTRKDFQSWQSAPFTVSAGETVNFSVPLEPADSSTKTPAAPPLPMDISRTGTSQLVAAQQMDPLPTNGRRLDQLIPMAVGVTQSESQPGTVITRSLPYSNTMLLDGIDVTNTYFVNQPGMARQISEDAVQDFQVMSSNYPAEYTRTAAGVMNAATRSGAMDYHGTLYDYWRARGLQARDPYAAGYDTRQSQQQAGANLGGPIHGDRLFFFLNFEGLYRKAEGLNRITNPLIADSTGHFVLPSNCTATAAQCAAAVRFLQSQMNVLEPLSAHSGTGVAKIDYRRSDRNFFTFEANASHWIAPSLAQVGDVAPNGGLIGDPNLHEETRYAKVDWTGIVSPVTLNDFRLGFSQDRISEIPTQTAFPTGPLGISIAGTTAGATLPYGMILPSERRVELVDNFRRTYGTHLFEAGVDLSQTRDYLNSLANPAGLYTYNSLTAFAEDFGGSTTKNYTTFSQTFGNPSRAFTTKEYNFYADDTWKATRRLTVQYALIYEKPYLPQPTEVNPAYYQTGSVASPWLDLSGRVGLAYMLDSHTVLRAAFGMFYQPFPGVMMDDIFLGNGLYQTQISVNPNQVGAPVFPTIIPSVAKIPAGTTNITYAAGKLKNPYTQDFNVQLERQVYRDWTLTLGFIKTRGYDLWTVADQNLTPPTANRTYTIDNAAGQAVGTYTTPYYTAKNNTNFARVWQIENGGSFFYSGVTAQWRMMLPRGFSLWASYTYSHATDDLGPNSAIGFSLAGSTTGDFPADKGRSAFDQRQRAVIRWTWAPTLDGAYSPWVRHLVNGWGISGIATLASGLPVTPLVLVEGQQFSAITMDYTTSLNGSGGWNRVPFYGVNSLNLGSQRSVDARLARTFSFTERFKGTVALEMFNLLNDQYATMVNPVAFLSIAPLAPGLINGPQAGVMHPVPGYGNGIAAQGFPNGFNARSGQVMFRLDF
jgi:carboxypeptidase family protein